MSFTIVVNFERHREALCSQRTDNFANFVNFKNIQLAKLEFLIFHFFKSPG